MSEQSVSSPGMVCGFSGTWRRGDGPPRGRAWGAAVWHAERELTLGFAGEIYDLPALRRHWSLPPDAAASAVLSAAWRHEGEAGLARIDGMFACALADAGSLRLYRHGSGVHDLYVHDGPQAVAFATDIDALLALPGVPRQLSRRALHEYLRFLDVAAPETIYQGVQAMPDGAGWHWRPGARLAEPFAPADVTEPQPIDFDAAIDDAQQRLTHAIARRLEGGRRPASFLSGGVDSALIAALAAHSRPDLTTLTVGFDGERYDESPAARQIARHLGLAHEVLRFDHDEHVDAFERLMSSLAQPMADPATTSTLLAFERARERFDIILDGTGADEAMGAMPPRHVRIAVGWASLLPQPLRRAGVKALRALPPLVGYAPILDFEHPAEMSIRWRGFPRADVAALAGGFVSFDHTTYFRAFARCGRRDHYARASALQDAAPCHRLTEAVRGSAAPVRFPFWDRNVDRRLRALPEAWRHVPGQPKRLLRAL
ncbi:MAG TPA: asparagine synthase-related protein, partial [Burkholderiaceae bacterium]|nr:asparagine synthase-related protein [Burkholderiaceae bacterium]